MNADQAARLQAALEAACDAHIQRGGTIKTNAFFDGDARCPIACLSGSRECPITRACELVKGTLGFDISPEEMWSIVQAFDGNPYGGAVLGDEDEYVCVATWLIGKNLRARYIG